MRILRPLHCILPLYWHWPDPRTEWPVTWHWPHPKTKWHVPPTLKNQTPNSEWLESPRVTTKGDRQLHRFWAQSPSHYQSSNCFPLAFDFPCVQLRLVYDGGSATSGGRAREIKPASLGKAEPEVWEELRPLGEGRRHANAVSLCDESLGLDNQELHWRMNSAPEHRSTKRQVSRSPSLVFSLL